MPYWAGRAATTNNLRLFVRDHGWRSATDEVVDEEGRQPRTGAAREIGSILLNVLNATNVVVLTGTGASFAAVNPPGRPTPAGMWDVWTFVRETAGPAAFDAVVARFGEARVNDNIEKLLTLCKLYLELNAAPADDAEHQAMLAFVDTAEAAILSRVDFVDRQTDLEAHGALVRKVGRRVAVASKLTRSSAKKCPDAADRTALPAGYEKTHAGPLDVARPLHRAPMSWRRKPETISVKPM